MVYSQEKIKKLFIAESPIYRINKEIYRCDILKYSSVFIKDVRFVEVG